MNKKNISKKTVLPLGDRVLLRPLKAEDIEKKSASGIIIPTTVSSKDKPEQGTIIAVGPGSYKEGNLIPVGVSVGDRVIFSKYGYEEVNIEGETLYILTESQIFAIIK